MPSADDLQRGARAVLTLIRAQEMRMPLKKSEFNLIGPQAVDVVRWLEDAAKKMRARERGGE